MIFTFIFLLFMLSFDGFVLASVECDVCKETVHQLDIWMAENSTITEIDELAVIICELVRAGGYCEGLPSSWQCVEVCTLAVQTYTEMVDYVLIARMDPDLVCYLVDDNVLDCPVPPPTPDPTPAPNVLVDDQSRADIKGIGYFIQIPDVHVDPQFSPNTVANCGEPVCCRKLDNDHNYTHELIYAGKYGIAQYGITCDVGWIVLNTMYDYISTLPIANPTDLDFVIFVGDAIPHDVYNQSQQRHIEIMDKITFQMQDAFGEIPVFIDMAATQRTMLFFYTSPHHPLYKKWLKT